MSQQLQSLRTKYSPNILFFIARSKNENIVVYEANLDAAGKLNAKEPVKVYWLDIDPVYQAKNRAKGITSDKSELNTIENQFAYGLSATPYTGPETQNQAGYKIKLVALPERALYVYQTAGGETKGTMQVSGKQAVLAKVYVKSVDRMIGLPKVESVDLEGQYEDGSAAAEKIKS